MQEMLYNLIISSKFDTVEDINDVMINFTQEYDYYPIILPIIYNSSKTIDNIKSFYSEFCNINLFNTERINTSFFTSYNLQIFNNAFNNEYTFYSPDYIDCDVNIIDETSFNIITYSRKDMVPSHITDDYLIIFLKITNDFNPLKENIINDFTLVDFKASNNSFTESNYIEGKVSNYNREHYINWPNYSINITETYYDSGGFYKDSIQIKDIIRIQLDEEGEFKFFFKDEYKLLPGSHKFKCQILDNNNELYKDIGLININILKTNISLSFEENFIYRSNQNFDIEFILPVLNKYYSFDLDPILFFFKYNFNINDSDEYFKIDCVDGKYKVKIKVKREDYNEVHKTILLFIYSLTETLFTYPIENKYIQLYSRIYHPKTWKDLYLTYSVVDNTDYFVFDNIKNPFDLIKCDIPLTVFNKDLYITTESKTDLTPYFKFNDNVLTIEKNRNLFISNIKIYGSENIFNVNNGYLNISNCELSYCNELINITDKGTVDFNNNTLFNCFNDMFYINGGKLNFNNNRTLINSLNKKVKNTKSLLFKCKTGYLNHYNNITIFNLKKRLDTDIGYKNAILQASENFVINDGLVEKNKSDIFFFGSSNQFYFYNFYRYFHKKPEKINILIPFYNEDKLSFNYRLNVKYDDYLYFNYNEEDYTLNYQPIYTFNTNKEETNQSFICIIENTLNKLNICECFTIIARNLNYSKYDPINQIPLDKLLIPFKDCCVKNKSKVNIKINDTSYFPNIEFKANLNN